MTTTTYMRDVNLSAELRALNGNISAVEVDGLRAIGQVFTDEDGYTRTRCLGADGDDRCPSTFYLVPAREFAHLCLDHSETANLYR